MALTRTALGLVLSATMMGCEGDRDPISPAERSAERLWFFATGLTLIPGDTARMGVTAADSAVTTYVTFPDYIGNPWPADLHIRWWTSDTSRATVDSSGLVTARAVGRTAIWVGVGATIDSGTVIVETDPSTSGFAAHAVAGGLVHTCGLRTTGQAYCWGSDFAGALGRGQLRQFNSAATPSAVSGGRQFASLAVGANFACALTAAGTTYCWGGNEYGQLGDSTDANACSEIGGFGRAAPVAVLGGKTFTSVYAGGFHVCALDADGRAFCWGWNGFGQLAVGPYEGAGAHRSAPAPAADSIRFLSLGLGALHTCGISTDSITYCWGFNDRAQSGIDSISPDRCGGGSVCSTRPIAIDSRFRFIAVTAGRAHSCGLTSGGVAYCWGNRSPIPIAVTGPTFVRITAGTHHTCGLTALGAAYCWGENDFGQLGDGTSLTDRPDPVAVATALKFVWLDAGFTHTCGVSDDGWAYCWGRNLKGEIGNGTMQAPNAVNISTVLTPARVRAPLP